MATEAVWKTIQSGAASPCPNFEKIYHEVIFVYVRDQEKYQQKSVNFQPKVLVTCLSVIFKASRELKWIFLSKASEASYLYFYALQNLFLSLLNLF